MKNELENQFLAAFGKLINLEIFSKLFGLLRIYELIRYINLQVAKAVLRNTNPGTPKSGFV